MTRDLAYTSAAEALEAFGARSLSPVELVEAVIAQAEAVEPEINAFAETFYDEALAAARVAERRYSDGTARALEGIPVAVKEEAPIAGQLNTFGCVALRDEKASETAVFVQRIIDEGGIVHARTTTPEFSSAPVTWSRLWGVTRNPWNLEFSPGGSSGGSAAALAAGSTTLATGSDIGGSIRIPASFTGVVGFKPPYGRVPEVEIFNLDHYCHEGPLARTVEDCRLLENVIAGPHPSDVASLRPKLEIPDDAGTVTGMRIALSGDLGCYRVDQEVATSVREAAGRLRQLGANIDEVSLPWSFPTVVRASRVHYGMIFGSSIDEVYAAHRNELAPYTRRYYEEVSWVEKSDMLDGLRLEGQLYRPLGELLERYDALICPTFAIPAFGAEWDTGDPFEINGEPAHDWFEAMMPIPFNIASRCPVLCVPAGRTSTGVPVGLSIVGPTYDDPVVFRIARAFESADPWYRDEANRPPTGRAS